MLKRHLVLPLAAVAGAVAFALPAGAATSIKLKDDYFAPKSTSVSKGSTVTFRWAGKAPHNVTVTKGPVRFHSPTKTSGSFSRKLTKAGTYKIVCTLHEEMRQTITVKR